MSVSGGLMESGQLWWFKWLLCQVFLLPNWSCTLKREITLFIFFCGLIQPGDYFYNVIGVFLCWWINFKCCAPTVLYVCYESPRPDKLIVTVPWERPVCAALMQFCHDIWIVGRHLSDLCGISRTEGYPGTDGVWEIKLTKLSPEKKKCRSHNLQSGEKLIVFPVNQKLIWAAWLGRNSTQSMQSMSEPVQPVHDPCLFSLV